MNPHSADYTRGSLRDTVLSLFAEHGVTGEIRHAGELVGDEAVFVLTTGGAAMMRERELTSALTALLHRKVWVTTTGTLGEDEPSRYDVAGENWAASGS
jgi:hypothetical protein